MCRIKSGRKLLPDGDRLLCDYNQWKPSCFISLVGRVDVIAWRHPATGSLHVCARARDDHTHT